MFEKKNLAALIAVIAAHLRHIGAPSVRVCYSGSGDSGNGYETVTEDIDVEQALCVPVFSERKVGGRTRWETMRWGYQQKTLQGGRWKLTVGHMMATLMQALEAAADAAITASGHDGFANNEGGYGTFTIFADDRAELEHVDYVDTMSEPEVSTWNLDVADENEDSPVEMLAKSIWAVLLAAGVTEYQVGYYGFAGSGPEVETPTPAEVDENAEVQRHDGTTVTLGQAIEELLDAIVEEPDIARFWSDEGGSGRVQFSAPGILTSTFSFNDMDEERDTQSFRVVRRPLSSKGDGTDQILRLPRAVERIL